MSDATRRGFLAATGAGAATVAAVAAAPSVFAAPARQETTEGREPLLAYVRDGAKGELSIMVGEREVVVHDADLVSRLTRAARS